MNTLYAMPGNEVFTEALARQCGYPRRALSVHGFPDGETLLQMDAPSPGDVAILVCTLDRPDAKLWPLMMAASTARELGASRVCLVAPYLAYMRQDARFHPGEAVSARIFGHWLYGTFDGLVTVDPHLHRYHRIADIYPRPVQVVHVAAELAAWIATHVERPLIVGPDEESGQWVNVVANLLCAPSIVARKERRGDREVEIHFPELDRWPGHTPVLLDDIISSGQTMLQTVRHLRQRTSQPVCVAIHGVFADGALESFRREPGVQLVTSDSIVRDTTQIDISKPVADAVIELCGGWTDAVAGRASA